MVLVVSVANRDAIWQAPIGELQKRPLEIWSKALASSAGNYSSKDSSAYYWAYSVETECLTMGYQVTTQPELTIMRWEFSDRPSHKVEQVWQQSVIKWKWYLYT